jgi:hypothetical protein
VRAKTAVGNPVPENRTSTINTTAGMIFLLESPVGLIKGIQGTCWASFGANKSVFAL